MSDAPGDAEQQAEHLAEAFEGYSAAPYQDPGGIWTVGFGSIWDYRLPRAPRVTYATPPVTLAVARLFLLTEMHQAVLTVAHDVQVPLTDNQRAALEDFVFNLGPGNFAASTLLRHLRARDYAGAAAEFDKWDHAGGHALAGLLRRREVETALFQNPNSVFEGVSA